MEHFTAQMAREKQKMNSIVKSALEDIYKMIQNEIESSDGVNSIEYNATYLQDHNKEDIVMDILKEQGYTVYCILLGKL